MAQLLSTTVTGTLNVSSTLNTATSLSTPTINATTINSTSYVNATGVNMATVAGANQQIIFNNNSVSGATPYLTFNVAQNVLTVGNNTLVVNATSNNISTNTLLMQNAGSVAYPAIQMGATNRGFYNAPGGSIGFISAGYEQARLGLITSTVNYLLLSGANTGNAATLTAIGSDANISLGLTSINNSSIIFTTNATEVARINASGLGIGTSSPTSNLHVVGSANVSVNITVGSNLFVTTANVTANLNVQSNLFAQTAKVAGNTLTVGTTVSSTANGFSRLTNGLLFQWGNVSATNANTTVTFPAAFTTLYQVTVSTVLTGIAATGANVNATSFITTSNATAFNVRTNSATANAVNWMAIGV